MTRGWRRASAVPAVLVAVLLAFQPGCVERDRDGAAERGLLQAVLDRQAEAVLTGDREAYLATVDPRADGYRKAQRTVFGNLARLPIDHWSYRVTDTGEDAFPLPADGGAGPRRIAVRAELRYRIEGYDPAPVRDVEYLTLTEREGRWYVSSDGDGDGGSGGRRGTQQLWEQGEMTLVRGERSLVLGVGRPEFDLRALAEDADRAVPGADEAWPRDWPRRVLVQAPATLERMAGLLGGPPSSYRGIAAVTTGEAGGRSAAPAERIVVNPEAYWLLGEEGRRIVMTHEVTHVATREHTTGSTPLWLSEGFADWAAYRGVDRSPARIAPLLTDAVRDGEVPRRLPTDEEFAFAGDADRLARSYESGWLLCRMVAQRWGEEKLVELYLAVGGSGGDMDPVVREVLGTGMDGLTERWREYVRRELGGR
ncbi:peptidase MA family metallohydrolase [Streptomyces sp. SS8]